MNVLFVIDRLELKYFEFNDLVTNFWIIKGLLERDINVDIATIDNLGIAEGKGYVNARKSFLKNSNIFYAKDFKKQFIENYNLVIFRPDPPVDLDYINATYVFDFVDENKVKIVNSPSAIRNFNEKLHSLRFKEFMSDSIVTNTKSDILEFLDKHHKLVLKPMNSCFGSGVMLLNKGDANTTAIINIMTQNETKKIMVQEYIEGAQNGDMRVLTLGNRVLPQVIRKLPGKDDFKFNEHADKSFVPDKLNDNEILNFTKIAEVLNQEGLSMVGFDIVKGKILEINVTSPCYFIRENNQHFGGNLENAICDYLIKIAK